MKLSFPLHRKLFVSHFLTTFIVSSALGVFVYLMAQESILEQLQHRLSSSAALISREIDANTLRDIRFERDTDKREYLATLKMLREMRRSNDDIAFLYVMRKTRDGKVKFVVDSDETEDQALPGMEYEEATSELLSGFSQRSADSELTTDQWGSFFSGYAPLRNGHGEFLVGVDMRADDVYEKLSGIRVAGLGGLFTTLLVSWGIAVWMSRHFKKPIDAIVEQVQAVGAGDFDRKIELRREDELATLLSAINDMTTDLKQARDDNIRLAESLDDAFLEDRPER
ncbi:HAMP domain-containing protein [Pelagicoccus mobilis]|uniref:histidine kinase n=1 Tax=Pelagicoccus mobilis TaxID=415221 RepID=A0A934S1I9_9BACT|nr:HAMP domain-containing protein [Pelagicoccus mobilis]MBK1877398.1 HAMP domain-containing protein [Pelagicoccus mobilis]